jgi:hypothetical protein
MPILDVKACSAFKPTADVTVTAPDGNTYTATSDTWWGVPYGSAEMIFSTTSAVLLMSAGSHLKRSSGSFVQVGTVDFIRNPV